MLGDELPVDIAIDSGFVRAAQFRPSVAGRVGGGAKIRRRLPT